MRHAKTSTHSRWLHALALVAAMLSWATNGANARAEGLVPSDYRYSAAGDKFDSVRQYAVAFEIRPPRRLRARRLELAVGSISSSSETRAFVSLGPVWRLPITQEAVFVEFAFSPTLLTGSDFNGRELGGNFHFTSSIAVGATLGRRQAIAVSLRAQHTSNGGLSGTNPGIDMVGINVAINFANR